MRERQKLHSIIDTLPQDQVNALLTLLDTDRIESSAADLRAGLADDPALDVAHDEMLRRLGG